MSSRNSDTLIICATALSIVVVTAVTLIFIATPGDAALARVAILLGVLAPTITGIGNLVKTDKAIDTAESVKADTNRILNGEGQAKIESALHAVLDQRALGQPPDKRM